MKDRAIFNEAIGINDRDKREAFARDRCGGDPDLLDSVLSLLESHDESTGFLEKPAMVAIGEAEEDDPTKTSVLGVTPANMPKQLGHYEILEVLGRGGGGVVYRAHDPKLDRNVAIKWLAGAAATSSEARQRFIREAHAAAAVSHPHVITIHAVDEQDDIPYLVMECIEGQSLHEKLKQAQPLSLEAILRIGMQTAQGLAAAHQQGLIHRDVKPGNIMLENGVERVKITDFGIARAVDDVQITLEGRAIGTPQYMSPQQAKGERVDHRTDLFSLGVVLYKMCSGVAPFDADNSLAILRRVCEDTPSSILEANPEIPDWLDQAILQLLEKNPADRIQSADELAQLFAAGLAHIQSPAGNRLTDFVRARNGDATAKSRGGRRWGWAASLTAILALVALIAIVPQLLPNEDRPNNAPGNTAGPATPAASGDHNALSFDGIDDFVAIPSLRFDYSKPFTLEVVCRPDNEKADQVVNIDPMFLSEQGEAASANESWVAFNFDRRHRSWWAGLGFREGDKSNLTMLSQRHAAGSPEEEAIYAQSQHLAIQWDGDEYRLYRDGKIVDRVKKTLHHGHTVGDSPPDLPASIGRAFTPEANDLRYFTGIIRSFRFSAVARYGESYQPQPRFATDVDTVALFLFDQDGGEELKDLSGNGHHGKIVGATRVWVDEQLRVVDGAAPSK